MRKLFIALILGITLSFGGIGLSTSYAQDAGGDKPAAAAAAEPAVSSEAKPEEAKSEEKSEEAKPEEAKGGEVSWFTANFHIILEALIGLVVALGLWGRGRQWILDKIGKNKAALFSLVEQSVMEVYHEYVKPIKTKKKLDKEQVKLAQKKAIEKIKEKAKTVGLKIAQDVLLPILIEKAINGIRRGTKD